VNYLPKIIFLCSIRDLNDCDDPTNTPLDFSPQMYQNEMIFLTPKLKPLNPYFNFLRPFPPSVWLLWLTTLIASGLASFVINYIKLSKKISFWRVLLDLFGSMWSQSE
jgi:hypothetical protein